VLRKQSVDQHAAKRRLADLLGPTNHDDARAAALLSLLRQAGFHLAYRLLPERRQRRRRRQRRSRVIGQPCLEAKAPRPAGALPSSLLITRQLNRWVCIRR
jgi:hypothetical protein